MKKFAFFAVFALLLALTAHADQKSSELKFVVVKEESGKPVRNASVILHPVDKEGRQAKGGLQVKTDADGHASVPATPYGKMRVQVLAPGFQTFGDDYEINQPNQEITVKLKRPQKQYSIYEDNPKK
jgi:Carboxypeptidase regulatory-like domain